jgi:hypothetical protein
MRGSRSRPRSWCAGVLVAAAFSAAGMVGLAGAQPPAERPLGAAGPTSVRPVPIQSSPDFVPIPDRWRLGLPDWNRYDRPVKDSPYEPGHWWDPYHQNILKGDYPILGQNIFMSVAAISDSLLEFRRIPLPSNVAADDPGRAEFFGKGDQLFFNHNLILSLEIFRGDTAFKPRDWEFRITPVFSVNYLDTRETGVVNVDVREGTTRVDTHLSLQELFVEYHLGDLSPHYDFISTRSGIQPFVSDFRGFIFSDNQLGFRLFGNLASNRNQFNAAYFYALEKDTNSGLNEIFHPRLQHIAIANFFRQDFLVPGYTLMFNFHYLNDRGEKHFDENGFLVRPAPVGTLDRKKIDAFWLGWNGDGHIGRLNLTHAFYWVLGREEQNPINGRNQDISAQMAAIEASVDLDWLRPRASFFWASGDPNPDDKSAKGFDSIQDNPFFAGGGFSYWIRQGIPLTGTGLELTGRNSILPALRSSKIEGQPNFVNPGIFQYNVGLDADITPSLKTFFNASYLRFHHTDVLEKLLFQPNIDKDIGVDVSLGMRWRPFLIDNVIVNAGVAFLHPLDGFKDVYTEETFKFGPGGLERKRSFPYDLLYSAFLSVTLTY